jgi:hypothetical protein
MFSGNWDVFDDLMKIYRKVSQAETRMLWV